MTFKSIIWEPTYYCRSFRIYIYVHIKRVKMELPYNKTGVPLQDIRDEQIKSPCQ